MKKLLIAFLLPASFIFSCKEKNTENANSGTTGTRLTESSLYNPDSIKSYLSIITDKEKEAGKKKFLEAIDLLKNKNQADKGILAFKSAALLYPSDKTYFELGSALLEKKQYDEARKALNIAELMGYSPLANVMYKLAALYSQSRDGVQTQNYGMYINDSLAIHYMEVALQMGYAKPNEFMKEKIFDSLRYYNDWDFKNKYTAAMSGNRDPEKLIWETFKEGFPELQLPLIVNTVWIYSQNYENAIGYDFEKFVPEMRTGKFSREVDNEYFYAGKVKEDSVFTALLYAGKNMWVTDGRGYSPVYLYLVTYSPSGKIIDKMIVGGQKTFTDNFRTVSLKENLYFELKDFRNVYEKDPTKNGFEDNKVAKSDLLSSGNYRINKMGKIEKAEQLAMN